MFIYDDVEPPHKGGFTVDVTARFKDFFKEFIIVDKF